MEMSNTEGAALWSEWECLKEMYRMGFIFTRRVVDTQNTLPDMVVEANMTVTFKNILDRHMHLQGKGIYGLCIGRRKQFNLA